MLRILLVKVFRFGATKLSNVVFINDLDVLLPKENLSKPGPMMGVIQEDFHVDVNKIRCTVPAGMDFDGASVPRAFRSIVPRSGRILYAAAVHDAAYKGVLRLDGEQTYISRTDADQLFIKINRAANVGYMTRSLAFLAVRWFGNTSFKR